MPTINVQLGTTLCINPDERNFIRLGVEANDISVDGDVEAQAQASLTAAVTVMRILDNGLQEMVTEVMVDFQDPATLKGIIESHDEKIEQLGRLVRGSMQKIRELTERTDHGTDRPE